MLKRCYSKQSSCHKQDIMDLIQELESLREIYHLSKRVLELIDNCADFSNGVDGCGVDEGQVRAEEIIRPLRNAINLIEGK